MKQWHKWLKAFAFGSLIIFTIFIFNQLAQLYRSLALIHPTLGLTVIGLLVALLVYFTIKTVRILVSLPKEVELADGAGPEEYETYVRLTLLKLKHNPNLELLEFDWDQVADLPNDQQVKVAYQVLHEASVKEIKTQASTVFLSTAISQNGSLDSLTVLLILTKMVWRLIKTYDTRPSLGKVVAIYTNVATTTLMARGIEDLDLIEAQVEPLITSILGGSLLSMIPGSVSITNLIANSILEGSVNALLTLRVGIITINYLGSLQDLDNQTAKRSATLEATKLLGSIIKDGSINVVKVMTKSVKKAGISTTKKLNPFAK